MSLPEVELFPIKKIVLHNIHKTNSISDLLKIIPNAVTVMSWSDGYLMVLGFFPDSEKIVELYLEGIHHLGNVWYCKLEKYIPSVKNQSGFELSVMNTSDDTLYSAISNWLKEHE